MPIIYIAGPLLNGHTASDDVGMENMYKGIPLMHKLMQKGWSPYYPHFSMVMYKYMKDTFNINIPWSQWMQLDSSFLRDAKALFFIGHSKGADRELAYATNRGYPIYLNIDDVPNVDPDLDLLTREEIENLYKVIKIND